MTIGANTCGVVPYGGILHSESAAPTAGRTTKNSRQTINTHAGVSFQIVQASQGIS